MIVRDMQSPPTPPPPPPSADMRCRQSGLSGGDQFEEHGLSLSLFQWILQDVQIPRSPAHGVTCRQSGLT